MQLSPAHFDNFKAIPQSAKHSSGVEPNKENAILPSCSDSKVESFGREQMQTLEGCGQMLQRLLTALII